MSGVETMIDINKQYTTRRGREVRIYATDGGGDYPVHGAIKQSDGTWEVDSWTNDGLYIKDDTRSEDLIEVPPRIKGWANIYADVCGFVHSSRGDADAAARPDRIACVEIDVPHGHGLDLSKITKE